MRKLHSHDSLQLMNNHVLAAPVVPADHLLQLYDTDDTLLTSLVKFNEEGFLNNEACIVIATQAHLDALRIRLESKGFDVEELISRKQYFPVDAQAALSVFMVNGWPDVTLFNNLVNALVADAGYGKRTIRAFGEMVALLWNEGQYGATIALEELWNKFCSEKPFVLLCAYPKQQFEGEMQEALQHICKSHSHTL